MEVKIPMAQHFQKHKCQELMDYKTIQPKATIIMLE
jgi:predicted nucleic acid-binding Zn ribbon protein